jgi:hypothetical protein
MSSASPLLGALDEPAEVVARRWSTSARVAVGVIAFATAWMVGGVRATPAFAEDGGERGDRTATEQRHDGDAERQKASHRTATKDDARDDDRAPVRQKRQNSDACLPTPVPYGPNKLDDAGETDGKTGDAGKARAKRSKTSGARSAGSASVKPVKVASAAHSAGKPATAAKASAGKASAGGTGTVKTASASAGKASAGKGSAGSAGTAG